MHGRLLVVLIMLAAPATGSLIESTTGVSYQFDGDTDRDAPDTCLEAHNDFFVPLDNATNGFLVPVEDEADHYVLDVDDSLVGTRITVRVSDATEIGIALDVQVPGCEGSVLDEDQQPAAPAAPPEPAEGEQQAGLSNLDGSWECGQEWFFVINQVHGGIAPESVHVIWSNGLRADVPLAKDTPATIAQYSTTENLGVTVHSAYANLPEDWEGRFNIGRGPCDAQDGGAVFGEPATASADNTTISFTPTQVGAYVTAVLLEPVLPEISFGPQPADCHACVDGGEDAISPLMYLLAGDAQDHAT